MDDMEQRVRAAADALISCHAALRKDPKDAAARGSTIEAVHEMRKITARIEIDLAISERDEMAAKPIPIPPHRSSRKAGGETGGDDNIGNMADMDDPNDRQPMSNRSGGFRNNNSGPRQGGGGGGNNSGGPRRRMGMGGPHGGSQGNNRPQGDRPSGDDQQ